MRLPIKYLSPWLTQYDKDGKIVAYLRSTLDGKQCVLLEHCRIVSTLLTSWSGGEYVVGDIWIDVSGKRAHDKVDAGMREIDAALLQKGYVFLSMEKYEKLRTLA